MGYKRKPDRILKLKLAESATEKHTPTDTYDIAISGMISHFYQACILVHVSNDACMLYYISGSKVTHVVGTG